MSSDSNGLPETPEAIAGWMDGLQFHPDRTVPDDQLPPLLDEDEDVLVPRSVKLPQRLDDALQRIADRRKLTKSELVRQYLEASVAAELAGDGTAEVFIPLSEALRALAGLPHLPRSA
jgi:Ribbon-helix-helix protein, copG family